MFQELELTVSMGTALSSGASCLDTMPESMCCTAPSDGVVDRAGSVDDDSADPDSLKGIFHVKDPKHMKILLELNGGVSSPIPDSESRSNDSNHPPDEPRYGNFLRKSLSPRVGPMGSMNVSWKNMIQCLRHELSPMISATMEGLLTSMKKYNYDLSDKMVDRVLDGIQSRMNLSNIETAYIRRAVERASM